VYVCVCGGQKVRSSLHKMVSASIMHVLTHVCVVVVVVAMLAKSWDGIWNIYRVQNKKILHTLQGCNESRST